MKTICQNLASVLLFVMNSAASAYELGTHGRLTYQAYKISVLPGSQFLSDLGIENGKSPFGGAYYDVSGNTVMERMNQPFEQEAKRMPNGVEPLSIEGWLMRGAIREDDAKGEKNPQDDRYNPDLRRPLHHFYDPANNRPLNVPGLSLIDSDVHGAPAWAVGSRDAFTQPNTAEANRRNHFTVFDAREAMYRALTGKTNAGLDAGPGNIPATESIRKTYWATLFRALGDILHLNQDMAQPQHTRNDPHSGKGPALVQQLLTGHKSFYENYIEARATGSKFTAANGTAVDSKPLTYGDYPIPAFAKYSDYWSTSPGASSVPGQGLADYSNRGFFSAGTNLGHNSYSSPSNLSANFGTEVLSAASAVGMSGNALDGEITFKTATVSDTLNPGLDAPNQRLTTYGAWDQFLLAAKQAPAYTLNYYNYDAMANLLIPRAVSYSAGLINYFFRGKMTISLPDEGVYGLVDHADPKFTNLAPLTNYTGFNKIKLKLSNTTPGSEAMSGGIIRAVLKFRRNSCYKDDLTGQPPFVSWSTCRTAEEEIVVSDPANGGGNVALTSTPQPFTFNFPDALPLNATDVYLQVVYRGTLGQETEAVVVATQDISEPSFFSYMNARDYILIGTEVYTRAQINADPNLISQIRPFSCVDYTVSPAQLQPHCFNPDSLSKTFTTGSQTTVQADMPVKRFMRIVFLGDGSPPHTVPTVFAKDEIVPCLPLTPISIVPVQWQTSYDPATNTRTDYYPEFYKIRGVSGSFTATCVLLGDGNVTAIPPDAKAVTMLPVASQLPVAVQINGAVGF